MSGRVQEKASKQQPQKQSENQKLRYENYEQ